MQAGLLREIIRFQESKTQRDELGGFSDNWVDVFSKRADVRFASGNRTLVNGEVFNPLAITCKIRYCRDVHEKMIIIYDYRKYRIISINRDRLQQCTVIQAELINE
jgi:putative phage head-tail adaptor|nr:MAG TPA: Putative head tail adaptor [Caudoviricetes sp.]